jgi:glycosyltransferase involved in cell wall biosynthesis
MSILFDTDPFPGKPKILFIGLAHSSHTQSWIDMLSGSEYNIRLFGMPGSYPREGYPVKTYSASMTAGNNSEDRHFLYSGISGPATLLLDKVAVRLKRKAFKNPQHWLAEIIRSWQPDIIHTLGMFDEQGGFFYYETRERFNLQGIGKWILQTRGGSDLALRRHNPETALVIQKMFNACHQIISDNTTNIRYAQELGISPEKFASIVPVPGTGGMDIAEFSKDTLPPSKRERIILWPKAYESQWSKALPVLEAIQLAWDKIKPCEIYMLAMTPEVIEWYLSLPETIRQHCHTFERIPRDEMISILKRSRILIIPSLVDGVPNSLYEAMSTGAFPIVSPLETLLPIVENEKNVLFARNLYPDEISASLIRAMNDDALVDLASQVNFKLVGNIANRGIIRGKIVQYYSDLMR